MRLPEIDRGDTLRHRALIGMISRVSGIRLPDAARVAFYDQDFAGPALGEWTQRTMRGPSGWSVSERELMAAAVASWNRCPFCVGAHGAIAVHGFGRATVAAVIDNYRTAPISPRLAAALAFIEKLTRGPAGTTSQDARDALAAGVSTADLTDAAAVASLFNIISRYANALDFEILPRKTSPSPPRCSCGVDTPDRSTVGTPLGHVRCVTATVSFDRRATRERPRGRNVCRSAPCHLRAHEPCFSAGRVRSTNTRPMRHPCAEIASTS